jgi:hypothetical protein
MEYEIERISKNVDSLHLAFVKTDFWKPYLTSITVLQDYLSRDTWVPNTAATFGLYYAVVKIKDICDNDESSSICF